MTLKVVLRSKDFYHNICVNVIEVVHDFHVCISFIIISILVSLVEKIIIKMD